MPRPASSRRPGPRPSAALGASRPRPRRRRAPATARASAAMRESECRPRPSRPRAERSDRRERARPSRRRRRHERIGAQSRGREPSVNGSASRECVACCPRPVMRRAARSRSPTRSSARDRSTSCTSRASSRTAAWLEHPSRAALYRRLASFSRLIIFDKRGTGMSDRVVGAPSLEVRMDDVRAVMDAAGSSRAALIGWSEGVPLGIVFAATYPERTDALVLIGGFARLLVGAGPNVGHDRRRVRPRRRAGSQDPWHP